MASMATLAESCQRIANPDFLISIRLPQGSSTSWSGLSPEIVPQSSTWKPTTPRSFDNAKGRLTRFIS